MLWEDDDKYWNADSQEPNAVSSVSPSPKLSLPVSPFTYTTEADSHFAYKLTVTSLDVEIESVYVNVFELLDIVPVLAVHPPNPYPVGLSINGFSISSILTVPFFTGTHLIFFTISCSSPESSEILPFFSLSVSPCAKPW